MVGLNSISRRVRETLCRHQDLPQFVDGRMFLKCVLCDRESRGWHIHTPAEPYRYRHTPDVISEQGTTGERTT